MQENESFLCLHSSESAPFHILIYNHLPVGPASGIYGTQSFRRSQENHGGIIVKIQTVASGMEMFVFEA